MQRKGKLHSKAIHKDSAATRSGFFTLKSIIFLKAFPNQSILLFREEVHQEVVQAVSEFAVSLKSPVVLGLYQVIDVA